MTASAKPPAWDMVETLTKSRLVVPAVGFTDPSQISAFGKWHWGTRDLDRLRELYLFDVEAVARSIIDHGPLFALSHGGHGINSYALSLVTTAPSGDVAFFTQHGFGGGYSDEDRDIAWINDAYQRVAREWEELDDGTRTDRVRWLVFSSFLRNETGIIDLDALRDGAEVGSALERIDDSALFDELKARRARRAAAVAPPASVREIVPHLAEALRRLEDDSHLVIGIHGSVRYVQFATFRPNLRLETIGPRYLEEGGEVMPVDELVWLADRGWHDADDGGNLWQEWIPADEDAAAAAAVEALVGVHGVTDVEQVWFYSGDEDALAAFDGYSPPAPTRDLQETSRARAAEINGALRALPRLPSGSKVVAVVDYIARTAVLEVLGFGGDEVFRRHDGGWREDPEWRKVLPAAPARSIVPLTQDQLDKVLTQIDSSTAGNPWKPFRASDLERYWPSHRPNDPDLFDWSRLNSADELHEP